MTMVLNDLLTRQNVFTNIILKEGNKELPKELKVKVMRIRMAYNKMRKNLDLEVQEFMEELVTDELKSLRAKKEKTQEEELRYKELLASVNSDYQEFLIQKVKEEITPIDDTFSEDEYSEIVEVNAGNDVQINGQSIPAINFLEIVHDLFVRES